MEYLIAMFVILALYIGMRHRERKVPPFPQSWLQPLKEKVLFYNLLNAEQKKDFQYRMMKFLNSVMIEGVQTELDHTDHMLVAASAIIPVFGFRDWGYPNLTSVLVYPNYFNEDLQFHSNAEGKNIGGLVGTGRFKNTMILSKTALHHGFDNNSDKLKTAIHEFVHLVDGLDGSIDGFPKQLLEEPAAIPWLQLMHQKMEDINKDESDIRNYGGTSQTEFFAVASEYFFSRPKLLKRKHPDLYTMLRSCYNQDLANRFNKDEAA